MPFQLVRGLYLDETILDSRVFSVAALVLLTLYKIPNEIDANNRYSQVIRNKMKETISVTQIQLTELRNKF